MESRFIMSKSITLSYTGLNVPAVIEVCANGSLDVAITYKPLRGECRLFCLTGSELEEIYDLYQQARAAYAATQPLPEEENQRAAESVLTEEDCNA